MQIRKPLAHNCTLVLLVSLHTHVCAPMWTNSAGRIPRCVVLQASEGWLEHPDKDSQVQWRWLCTGAAV